MFNLSDLHILIMQKAGQGMSIRDICKELGYTVRWIHFHETELVENGYLHKTEKKRGMKGQLKLTTKAESLLKKQGLQVGKDELRP